MDRTKEVWLTPAMNNHVEMVPDVRPLSSRRPGMSVPVYRAMLGPIVKRVSRIMIIYSNVQYEFGWFGCIEDLRRFSGISAISRLGSRR